MYGSEIPIKVQGVLEEQNQKFRSGRTRHLQSKITRNEFGANGLIFQNGMLFLLILPKKSKNPSPSERTQHLRWK